MKGIHCHVKAIIDGKLYDTKKAELIIETNEKAIFRTENENYFMAKVEYGRTQYGTDVYQYFDIEKIDENYLKQFLGKYFVDKYIELFGKVEDA